MKFLAILLISSFFSQVQAKSKPVWVGTSLNGVPCVGEAPGYGYGPYDYINPSDKKKIPVVEIFHFTKNVELLIKGKSGTLPSDLDYTLRSIPNHHKALLSTIRYQVKLLNKLATKKLLNSPECYLQRAINYNPKDAALYAIYGYYLTKIGRLTEAAKKYEEALKISPDNSKFEYSYSLLLVKLKEYKKALEYAKRAYKHGKPPNGLMKKLKRLGVWK